MFFFGERHKLDMRPLGKVLIFVVIEFIIFFFCHMQAIEMQLNPLLLMIPCTVASSFAFMLPVATPPNAVVYTNGILNIRDMVSSQCTHNDSKGTSLSFFCCEEYGTQLIGNGKMNSNRDC